MVALSSQIHMTSKPSPVAVLVLFAFAQPVMIPAANPDEKVQNFLYTSADDLKGLMRALERSEIDGVQVVYPWSLLEKDQDSYGFSRIEADLTLVKSVKKKFFLQIQDRFFSPDAKHVPHYLMTDPVYRGGVAPQLDNPRENKPQVSGWVAEQWNPHVQERYQKLLAALSRRFDGEIYGINLPETAIDLAAKPDKTGFTCDGYFDAEMANLAFARKAFQRSYVVQYVNFWPCEWDNDHGYMGRMFEFARTHMVGLGGPDIVPYQKSQMHNSYPFFFQYKGKLRLVAMAVQEPTLTYHNPKTGRPFTRSEFEDFAKNYLGANVIFWSRSAPWLSGG